MATSDHSARAEDPRPEHHSLGQACGRCFMAAFGHNADLENQERLRCPPFAPFPFRNVSIQ